MTTIDEAIQEVMSMYGKGVQANDARLVKRHVYRALQNARSTVIRQQSNKSQHINDNCYQDLSCVELEQTAIHECPCVPPAGCKILKTKHPIPTQISDLEANLINYVMTLDGGVRLDPTDFESVKNLKGNKFTSKKPRYYMKGQYLYVTTYTLLKAVVINGLFDDPIEAYTYPSMCNCYGCECKEVTEYEFPIDNNSLKQVVALAVDECVIMFKQMSQDRNANAVDDDIDTGSMIHTPNTQQQQD